MCTYKNLENDLIIYYIPATYECKHDRKVNYEVFLNMINKFIIKVNIRIQFSFLNGNDTVATLSE